MKHLVVSFTFFLCSVLCHVIWCRIKAEKGLKLLSFFVFAGIFFGVFLSWILSQTQDLSLNIGQTIDLWTFPLKFVSVLFYLSLIPFYSIVYSTGVIDSPSQEILDFLKDKQSCTYEQLLAHVQSTGFIQTRLETLRQHRFVEIEDQRYRLLSSGLTVANLLKLYQLIARRPQGG